MFPSNPRNTAEPCTRVGVGASTRAIPVPAKNPVHVMFASSTRGVDTVLSRVQADCLSKRSNASAISFRVTQTRSARGWPSIRSSCAR